MTHTPGPWTASWSEENTRLGLGSWFFSHGLSPVTLRRCSRTNKTAEANARLIAAAPELLAIVRQCVEELEGFNRMPMMSDGLADLIVGAHAAIAKATGES